jgi:hypothetical protein
MMTHTDRVIAWLQSTRWGPKEDREVPVDAICGLVQEAKLLKHRLDNATADRLELLVSQASAWSREDRIAKAAGRVWDWLLHPSREFLDSDGTFNATGIVKCADELRNALEAISDRTTELSAIQCARAHPSGGRARTLHERISSALEEAVFGLTPRAYDTMADAVLPIVIASAPGSMSGVERVEHHLTEARRIMYDEHWLSEAIDKFLASGIETEGHDPEEGHGAEHESPTSQSEGTPNPKGNPGPPGVRS